MTTHTRRHRLTLLTLLALLPCLLAAQHYHTTVFGGGWANVYDNYLSPLEYRGGDAAFMHENFRMTRHAHISTQGIWRIHAAATQNPAGNRDAVAARIGYQHAWHYNWQLWRRDSCRVPVTGVIVRAGLGVAGDIGGLCNTHGGNNPAQAYLDASIVASVGAEYPFAVRWWSRRADRQTFRLRVQVDAPVAGMMFSPDYGQPYYNIFVQGNYSRNVVFTNPFNAPTARGHVLLSVPVRRGSVTLGYTFDVLQAKPNHLRQHTYINNVMIGWTRDI